MKRYIFIFTVGYILGIIGELYIKSFPILFFIILCIYFILNLLNKKFFNIINVIINKKVIMIFCISIFISFINVSYKIKKYNQIYSTNFDGIIKATVIDNGEKGEFYTTYKIIVENNDISNKCKFYIKVSNNIKIKYGDKIEFSGKYFIPDENRNYGGFNYRNYLKSIKVLGIFKASTVKVISTGNINFFNNTINIIKNKIIYNINKIMANDVKELFLGILIGYDNNLQDDIKDSFNKSNLTHLLAVSGSHIVYINFSLDFILKKIRINKVVRSFFIISFLFIFMFITDLSSSVVRATIMGCIQIISHILHRKNDIKTSISLSLLIILILNPFKIYDIGLIFSYMATISIILFNNLLERKKENTNNIVKYINQIICITIYANILIIPISIKYFNTISFTFILSNLIAGILIEPITIIGFIIIFFSFISIKISYIISIPFNYLIKILILSSKIISQIPASQIYVSTISNFSLIIYYLTLIIVNKIIILNRKYHNRYLVKKMNIILKKTYKRYYKKIIIIVLIIFLFLKVFIINNNDIKIYFIDVGQGDATLIITSSNKKILIDGGGSENGYNVEKNVLLPYLLDRKVVELDYMIISHFDIDHCMAAINLIEDIKVKNIIIGIQIEGNKNLNNLINIVNDKRINLVVLKSGDKINIDNNTSIDVLWPNENYIIKENAINNNALVFKLNYNKFSMLFTGDIEKVAENKIIDVIDSKYIQSYIIKIAHHRFKKFFGK